MPLEQVLPSQSQAFGTLCTQLAPPNGSTIFCIDWMEKMVRGRASDTAGRTLFRSCYLGERSEPQIALDFEYGSVCEPELACELESASGFRSGILHTIRQRSSDKMRISVKIPRTA